MTKFRFILGDTPVEQEATPIRLALKPSESKSDDVDLVQLDDSGGTSKYILSIKHDGTFYRYAGGSFSDVRDDGRIKEANTRS
jgi:hypothetical protein